MIIYGKVFLEEDDVRKAVVNVLDINEFFHSSESDLIFVNVYNEESEYDQTTIRKSQFDIERIVTE